MGPSLDFFAARRAAAGVALFGGLWYGWSTRRRGFLKDRAGGRLWETAPLGFGVGLAGGALLGEGEVRT